MCTPRRIIAEDIPYHITTQVVNHELWFGIPENEKENEKEKEQKEKEQTGKKKEKKKEKIPIQKESTRLFAGIPRREVIQLFANIIAYLFRNYHFKITHFVLMSTHYHMVGEATDRKYPLNRCMQTFNMMVARGINRLCNRSGTLFASRYKSQAVTDERYGATLLGYIYANPVKAKLCLRAEDHDCSSYRCYVDGKGYELGISTDCPILEGMVIRKEERGKALRDLVEGYIHDRLEIKEEELRSKMKGQVLGDEGSIQKLRAELRDRILCYR